MLEYSITLRPLTEHHLQFLCLKEGCTGSSQSTLVKIPHCWKLYVAAHVVFINIKIQAKVGSVLHRTAGNYICTGYNFNPFKPNELSYLHLLDETISNIRGVGWYFFHFHSHSYRNFCEQTVETLIRCPILRHHQTQRSAESDHGFRCLPVSHKKDARLMLV